MSRNRLPLGSLCVSQTGAPACAPTRRGFLASAQQRPPPKLRLPMQEDGRARPTASQVCTPTASRAGVHNRALDPSQQGRVVFDANTTIGTAATRRRWEQHDCVFFLVAEAGASRWDEFSGCRGRRGRRLRKASFVHASRAARMVGENPWWGRGHAVTRPTRGGRCPSAVDDG